MVEVKKIHPAGRVQIEGGWQPFKEGEGARPTTFGEAAMTCAGT